MRDESSMTCISEAGRAQHVWASHVASFHLHERVFLVVQGKTAEVDMSPAHLRKCCCFYLGFKSPNFSPG